MDSVTDQDIDRIYKRVEQQIDLKTIMSRGELLSAVKDYKRRTNAQGGWNTQLNDAIWDRLSVARSDKLEFFKTQAIAFMRKVFIGINENKSFSVLYNKRTRKSYVVARDKKGRFTKYTPQELQEAIP